MADAKVIPFDDDRSRGSAVQRPQRRRSGGTAARARNRRRSVRCSPCPPGLFRRMMFL